MNSYLILIFIILIYHINPSSYIKLPFKNQRSISSLSSNEISNKIFDYLLKTDITIDLKIGTKPQIIPMSLSLQNKYIYITPNTLINGLYNKDNSITFNSNGETPLADFSFFKQGIFCNETFIFDSGEEIKEDNITFILTTEMANEDEERKGLIGLQIVSYRQEYTFINQLKQKKLINNYYNFIQFTQEDEGYFIIGSQPHEYNSNKYSSSNLRQVNTKEISSIWELYIHNIKYGENDFDSKSYFLDFNFGMISVGVNIKTEFYNDFFKERINKGLCQENIYKDYYIYSCINDDKRVKFNELKEFHFVHIELEYDFVFDYNDLFINYNNRKYFLITYKINSIATTLGKPFFKKYMMVFNPDNKQIGHYIKEEEIKNEENKDFKSIALIVIIIILIVIISFLGYMMNKILKRKKRKNELDENFEYIPKNSGILG